MKPNDYYRKLTASISDAEIRATLKQKQEQRRLFLLKAIRNIGDARLLTNLLLTIRIRTVMDFLDRYWDDLSTSEQAEIMNIHNILCLELQKRREWQAHIG